MTYVLVLPSPILERDVGLRQQGSLVRILPDMQGEMKKTKSLGVQKPLTCLFEHWKGRS